MEQRHAYDIVCDYFCMNMDELGEIIKEDPDVIKSWFTQPLPFGGHYFLLENSPVHNAFDKYQQLLMVAGYIQALKDVIKCDKTVWLILNRQRSKLKGNSFASIAKSAPNPLPEDNGLQDMLDKLQSWCVRKGIEIKLPR
ncbi:MAG: hypothetical protein K2Y22_14295 [Candidatus Obscuribacterales bacterium]|nr:hypothetical protein [Candidatus Obscuribacterales bacterium]